MGFSYKKDSILRLYLAGKDLFLTIREGKTHLIEYEGKSFSSEVEFFRDCIETSNKDVVLTLMKCGLENLKSIGQSI